MIRRLLFFLLYYSGISWLLLRLMINRREISVLLFHRVSNHSDLLWPSMPLKSFEKLIKKIHKSGQIILFNDLTKMQNYPSKPVFILSFDDGYSDFYENVMPILLALNIKANHNICPGLIDLAIPPWTQILSLYLSYKTSENRVFNDSFSVSYDTSISEKQFIFLCKELIKLKEEERNSFIMPLLDHIPKEKVYQLMSWDQIRYCAKKGIEIGSHGYMHRNLLQVKDLEILENEIKESGKKIAKEIGIEPNVFAFANAMGNKESKEFVSQSGYRFILILMDELLAWRPFKKEEKIDVPRINISRRDWREEYLRALGLHARVKQIIKMK